MSYTKPSAWHTFPPESLLFLLEYLLYIINLPHGKPPPPPLPRNLYYSSSEYLLYTVNLPHGKPSPRNVYYSSSEYLLYSKPSAWQTFPRNVYYSSSEYLLYSKPSPRILYYIVNIPQRKIYYIAKIPPFIADHPSRYFAI